MSRTYRNTEGKWYRRPKTMNEKTQLDTLLHDPEISEYVNSGVNHMRKKRAHFPASWDDIPISAVYENPNPFSIYD